MPESQNRPLRDYLNNPLRNLLGMVTVSTKRIGRKREDGCAHRFDGLSLKKWGRDVAVGVESEDTGLAADSLFYRKDLMEGGRR